MVSPGSAAAPLPLAPPTWAHWIDDFDLNEAVAYLLREDPERHPPPQRHPPPEPPARAAPEGSRQPP